MVDLDADAEATIDLSKFKQRLAKRKEEENKPKPKLHDYTAHSGPKLLLKRKVLPENKENSEKIIAKGGASSKLKAFLAKRAKQS